LPVKVKSFFDLVGIKLKDDPPGTFQYLMATVNGKKLITVDELWREMENYYRIRNCLAHQNGFVNRIRYYDKVQKYVSLKKLLNQEVCDTMMEFFNKVGIAYLQTPLPE
jgi:hypothetical protein